MKLNPLLLIDYYKSTHAEQYPKDITRLVSYYTPRMSRLEDDKKLVHFGLQYFIKEYLIDGFNDFFFKRDKEEVLAEYEYYMKNTMVNENDLLKRVASLHDLGYLPLELYSLPEGTIIPMQVPCVAITNTHDDFAWLVNTIESLLSATLWHAQISASVGMWYRNIVNDWYLCSCDDDVRRDKALGDFSFRGQESLESAVISSAGFLTSFSCSATVSAGFFLENYYGANLRKDSTNILSGSVSTEHSVMCSNYAVDGNEKTMIKRLLTEIYPNTSFSVVCDSYDYWNVVDVIIPELKEEILQHNGTMLCRGDSGCAEDIICGEKEFDDKTYHWRLYNKNEEILLSNDADIVCSYYDLSDNLRSVVDELGILYVNEDIAEMYIEQNGVYFIVIADMRLGGFDDSPTISISRYYPKPVQIGTVECLWNTFGGTINSKGYKVLDSHIKAIYGDSITIQKNEEIYTRLTMKGFACCNVVLGVGSFSMQCVEEYDVLQPFTRDTYSSAVKSTYCEIKGTPIKIFKNPKTDTGHFKKSQKGCCKVVKGERGELNCIDGLTWEQSLGENELKLVFKDGRIENEEDITEIRNRMWNGKF